MDFGMWLDCGHCWGLEADYFDITGKPDNYDSGLTDGFANGVAFPIVRLVDRSERPRRAPRSTPLAIRILSSAA